MSPTLRPNVGDVSIRGRNGAPSRKRCVANGQTIKVSSEYAPPRAHPCIRLQNNVYQSTSQPINESNLSLSQITPRVVGVVPHHLLYQAVNQSTLLLY